MNMKQRAVRQQMAMAMAAALMVALSLENAYGAVVGRAIDPLGDLNLTTFNGDADADAFPNQDLDFDLINENFTAGGDMFGLGRRGQFSVAGTANPHSGGDPGQDPYAFGATDDSLTVFTGDVVGIIKGGSNGAITDSDPFFAVVDTVNADTGDTIATSRVQSASWLFNVSGSTGGLSVAIDMAAMGDFEGAGSDFYNFEVSLDGGAFAPLFTSSVDDPADINQNYTLENPATLVQTLKDPLFIDGVMLGNEFLGFDKFVGSATSTLTIRLSALTDGGSEAFAFRNILIEDGVAPPAGVDGDYNDDGVVDAADYVVFRKLVGQISALPNDPNVGTTIDADQYNTWVAFFAEADGGPGGSGQVPEPAGMAMLAIGLAALCFRRRGA